MKRLVLLALSVLLLTGLSWRTDALWAAEPVAKVNPAMGDVVTLEAFSFQFPGAGKQEKVKTDSPKGPVETTQHSYETDDGHTRYVASLRPTNATADQLKAEQPLDALRESYKDQPGTKLEVERKITLGSYPGRDFIWIGDDTVIRSWAFLVDGQLLQLTVSFSKSASKMTPSKLAQFFDTLRLDGDKFALGTYTNEKAGLIPKLAEKYVKFSFRYPAAWRFNRAGEDDGSKTFVDVDRLFPTEKSSYIIDAFNVGPLTLTGPPELTELFLPELANQLADQLGAKLKDYKLESEGTIALQGASGYEVRFSASLEIPTQGTRKFFGRVILLTGHKVGVPGGVVLMLNATDVLAKITSAKDLGEKDQLAEVVKSFKFERE